jgi:hypothetical protein
LWDLTRLSCKLGILSRRRDCCVDT